MEYNPNPDIQRIELELLSQREAHSRLQDQVIEMQTKVQEILKRHEELLGDLVRGFDLLTTRLGIK